MESHLFPDKRARICLNICDRGSRVERGCTILIFMDDVVSFAIRYHTGHVKHAVTKFIVFGNKLMDQLREGTIETSKKMHYRTFIPTGISKRGKSFR